MENQNAIKNKIFAYCNKAERCHSEVRNKLFVWKIPVQMHDEILAELITENLLNEQRYALAYAHDHLVFRKWGREKIRQGLMRKNVSSTLISLALSSIEDEIEKYNLKTCADQKWRRLKDDSILKKRMKLTRYLYGKGFEMDEIQEVVNEILRNERA